MKKGAVWILILLLIFSAVLGGTEEAKQPDTADIQNSLITEENRDQSGGGIHEILQLIIKLGQDAQLNDLLNIQEVQELVQEGLIKATGWLIENPTVAVKVMVELGLKQVTAEAVGVLLNRLNQEGKTDINSLDEEDQEVIRQARFTIITQLLEGIQSLDETELETLRNAVSEILTGGNRQ